VGQPGTAGPFGIVVDYLDSPTIGTIDDARTAGMTRLSRTTGLVSQPSLAQAQNPALDAFQTIDMLPPRIPFAPARDLERCVVDSVTHPLTLGETQHIEGRSIRTNAFGGGS
jgi:hypothetical protein